MVKVASPLINGLPATFDHRSNPVAEQIRVLPGRTGYALRQSVAVRLEFCREHVQEIAARDRPLPMRDVNKPDRLHVGQRGMGLVDDVQIRVNARRIEAVLTTHLEEPAPQRREQHSSSILPGSVVQPL